MFFFLRLLLLLVFLINNHYALTISPVRANLSLHEPVTTVSVRNDSNESVVLQLQLYKWTQQDQRDILTPTEALIVSPQIFTLAAYSSQLIRIGLDSPRIQATQQAYRLIIEEVRSPFKAKKLGIQFILKMSVPIIVGTSMPLKEDIRWKILQSNKKTELQATNQGNAIIFVSRIAVLESNKQVVAPFNTFSYLLPGSSKKWPVLLPNLSKQYRIEANINNHLVTLDAH